MSRRLLAHHVDGPAFAPALLLLHPIATHSAVWAAQVAVWSAQFRVIRVDLPGHGHSEPPDQLPDQLPGQPLDLHGYAERVREVLDALSVPRVAVVGLSLGGMVAQAFVLAWPERVSALVLAHTTARTEPAVREQWERRLEQSERAGLEAQVAPTLERWFTRDFAAGAPLTLEFVAAQIRATSMAGYVCAVRAIQQLDHLERLGEIAVPTLVVAGAADSAVPPAVASALAARIPGASLVVIEEAAHIGCVQQPVRFTEAVGAFLSRALALEQA